MELVRFGCFVIFMLFSHCVVLPVVVQSSDIIPTKRTSIVEEIHAWNASCYPKDTCRTPKARRFVGEGLGLSSRNCFCDESCSRFGDCCPDSIQFQPKQQPIAESKYTCLPLRQYNFNWIIDKCPSDWKDVDAINACETPSSDGQMDPVSQLPVTSLITGATYRNLNCVLCHENVTDASLYRFWNPRLECNSIVARSAVLNQIGKDVLKSKVHWNAERNMWGLTIDTDGKGERFHPCFVDPSLPNDLQSYLRPCQPSISTCPSNWTDNDTRSSCLSYTSYVYRSLEVYRNVHCARCNGIPPQELTCDSISFRKLPGSGDFNPSAFALLFDLKDNDGSGMVGQEKSCPQDGQLYDPFSRKCRTVYCSQDGSVYREGRCQDSTTNVTDSTISETDWTESNFTVCPKFFLTEDEVEWLPNGTLYVPSYQKSYEIGMFNQSQSGIWICASEGVNMVSKFDPILGWVTVAGLGLSEICLALHLTAFLLSSELRNISSRNLASLSLALFAAYGCFILAQFAPTSGDVCVALAVLIFYFFLAAFWWTSVLAWDVWRTIRMATVHLRSSSSGQQWGKFVCYSLYAWLVPALIVSMALTVENLDESAIRWWPNEYRPYFGRGMCWFGHRKAILIFFASPLAVILSINLTLFASSAYMIRSTTANSPASTNQEKNSRKQLGLYVRLALIMGLSWVVGLIAGAANITPLWYGFVALCSLQGVFILLAYTCNPKVVKSVRNRILGSCGRRKYRSSVLSFMGSHLKRRQTVDTQPSDTYESSSASKMTQSSQLTSPTSQDCAISSALA